MKKITQSYMAKELEITDAYMSEIFSGKHPISRPLAEKLSDKFPWKTFKEWRASHPKEIKQAFLTKGYLEDVA